MKTLNARFNHGRWIADCPNCKTGAEEARPGEPFLCRNCHPQLLATMFVPRGDGRGVVPAPDMTARLKAGEEARRRGEVYQVVFPMEKSEIERLCRELPTPFANWQPGWLLDGLRAEVRAHKEAR